MPRSTEATPGRSEEFGEYVASPVNMREETFDPPLDYLDKFSFPGSFVESSMVLEPMHAKDVWVW